MSASVSVFQWRFVVISGLKSLNSPLVSVCYRGGSYFACHHRFLNVLLLICVFLWLLVAVTNCLVFDINRIFVDRASRLLHSFSAHATAPNYDQIRPKQVQKSSFQASKRERGRREGDGVCVRECGWCRGDGAEIQFQPGLCKVGPTSGSCFGTVCPACLLGVRDESCTESRGAHGARQTAALCSARSTLVCVTSCATPCVSACRETQQLSNLIAIRLQVWKVKFHPKQHICGCLPCASFWHF